MIDEVQNIRLVVCYTVIAWFWFATWKVFTVCECICSYHQTRLLIVLFYILFVCKCVLPPGDNPTAVNKYINIIIIIFILRTPAFKAYCAIWVRRSNFRHQASPHVSPRERPQRRKVELWARNVR